MIKALHEVRLAEETRWWLGRWMSGLLSASVRGPPRNTETTPAALKQGLAQGLVIS